MTLRQLEQARSDAQAGQGLERVAARRAIKSKLAELALREQRRTEISSAIATLDDEADAAVTMHAQETEPIQAELREIADAEVAAMLKGLPTDQVRETRRRELQEQLAALNEQLEKETDEVKRKRLLLERELCSPALDTAAKQTLESNLVRLGDPERLERHQVLQNTLAWAQRRLQEATAKRNQSRGLLEHARSLRGEEAAVATYTHRLRKWSVETDEAERQVAAATAAVDALRAEIIDE